MGISHDRRHRKLKTGGKLARIKVKRKCDAARNPASTKLGAPRIRKVRVRGGNLKLRALRLNSGLFAWRSEGISLKTKVLDVIYNATSTELIRTKTIVKNAILMLDATPYKNWYQKHYGVAVSRTGQDQEGAKLVEKKNLQFVKKHPISPLVAEQIFAGKILGCVSSRPGQTGRCDGYILEGDELSFYKKLIKKKGKHT